MHHTLWMCRFFSNISFQKSSKWFLSFKDFIQKRLGHAFACLGQTWDQILSSGYPPLPFFRMNSVSFWKFEWLTLIIKNIFQGILLSKTLHNFFITFFIFHNYMLNCMLPFVKIPILSHCYFFLEKADEYGVISAEEI